MAIVSTDLFFVASERMVDNPSPLYAVGGGGDMGTVIVQDAVQNNAFPDVMPGDRLAGLVQMRKLYATVLSSDNDTLANAQVGFLTCPTDANVETCVFPSENTAGADEGFVSSEASNAGLDQGQVTNFATLGAASGNTVSSLVDTSLVEVGDLVTAYVSPTPLAKLRKVTSKTASSVTFDGAAMPVTGLPVTVARFDVFPSSALQFFGRLSALSKSTAAAAASATAVTLDRVDVRVANGGFLEDSLSYGRYGTVFPGRQPLYGAGDVVLLQHPTVPATREFATVLRVNYLTNVVTLSTGLVNAYPVGSGFTRPLPLRSIQAVVSAPPFAQQAWTRTWADVIIGSPITARYVGAVGLINEGAVNDRWVVVFTSATQFTVSSERLGQVGGGNTGVNCTPLNPMTNQPYFTLYASAWGSGWGVGNALRFNTRAAACPVWVSRCIAPGSGSGTDEAALFIRGDVDA